MKPPESVSLFDVEDVHQMPKVRDMTVGPVSPADVREFTRRYHYTATSGSAVWRWGLWHGPVLLGIVAYNLPTRSVCESVFGAEHFDKVWHMGRLVLAEDCPRNSESRLIGGSLRAIEREQPHVWAVLTYADTSAGHIGTVYQATNAIYTGTGGESWCYVDKLGNPRATHQQGHRVSRTRASEMGWSRRNGGSKHRYLYVLGTKRQRRQRLVLLRYPSLPYPKAVAA